MAAQLFCGLLTSFSLVAVVFIASFIRRSFHVSRQALGADHLAFEPVIACFYFLFIRGKCRHCSCYYFWAAPLPPTRRLAPAPPTMAAIRGRTSAAVGSLPRACAICNFFPVWSRKGPFSHLSVGLTTFLCVGVSGGTVMWTINHQLKKSGLK